VPPQHIRLQPATPATVRLSVIPLPWRLSDGLAPSFGASTLFSPTSVRTHLLIPLRYDRHLLKLDPTFTVKGTAATRPLPVLHTHSELGAITVTANEQAKLHGTTSAIALLNNVGTPVAGDTANFGDATIKCGREDADALRFGQRRPRRVDYAVTFVNNTTA
jgi:hypothetical protein